MVLPTLCYCRTIVRQLRTFLCHNIFLTRYRVYLTIQTNFEIQSLIQLQTDCFGSQLMRTPSVMAEVTKNTAVGQLNITRGTECQPWYKSPTNECKCKDQLLDAVVEYVQSELCLSMLCRCQPGKQQAPNNFDQQSPGGKVLRGNFCRISVSSN